VVQGFGLSNSNGVAAFLNGDTAPPGSYSFKSSTARLFLRQSIDLGGERKWVPSDQNQLADMQSADRIVITTGRFAATDIFDTNQYSHDPRTQFMNAALADAGSWDYPQDSRGYTVGGTIELYRGDWALRYGALITPRGNQLAAHGVNSLGNNFEEEYGFRLGERPGVVRVLEFYNRGLMGKFSDALGQPGDPNVNIAADRRFGKPKWGIVINGEQELIDDLGVFARISYNDGKTEEINFADIDRSISVGFSLKGGRWDRPDDVIGLGGVVNGLSAEHRRFLAAGGLGITVGDGVLPHYAVETAVELYYALRPLSFATVTVDYQFVANPAYNADRGPVSVFALRVHLQY
jgi:high affinity Mn2+ porin